MKIFRNEKLIDREKEIKFLKDWFESLPKEILWIYGPKSSGKTTLIEYIVENELFEDFTRGRLKGNYWVKYINLRGKLISGYKTFLESFIKPGDKYVEERISSRISVGIFELKAEKLKKIRDKSLDLFDALIDELENIGEKNRIIIIDEIQTLEDIYINGSKELLKEFLNFCVRLTKELHLSHVVILSSNTIFIDRIYNEAKLKKTSTFYKVDHLERTIVEYWLKESDFTDKEIGLIWEYLGGSIFDIQRLLRNLKGTTTLKEYLEHQRWLAYTEIVDVLAKLKSKKIEEVFRRIAEIIIKNRFYMSKTDDYEEREVIEKFSEKEILFFDPLSLWVTGNNRLYEKGMEIFLENG